MKSRTALLLGFLGFFLAGPAFSAEKALEETTGRHSCDPGRSIRRLEGPEKLLKRLRANAGARDPDIFFADGKFDEETLTYIGETKSPGAPAYHVVALSTVWGYACRGTHRLLLFDSDGAFLGQYGMAPAPTRIDGARVLFDAEPEEGNALDLRGEPPPILHAYGDLLDFTPAVDSDSPVSVVKAYCLHDFQGHRLYGNMLVVYVTWEKEPQWEGFRVVERYEAGSERRSGSSASVTVRYVVAGDVRGTTWQPAGTARAGSSGTVPLEEKVRFELIKKDGGWRIAEPRAMPPHVSVLGAVDFLGDRAGPAYAPVLRALGAYSEKKAAGKASGN